MIKTDEELFDERVIKKGGFLIFVASEPCFTCGHKKRMAYAQKTDGRIDVIKRCMFCSVTTPTAANREGT